MRLPDLVRNRLPVAAGRDDGADAEVGVTIQMIDQVLAGELFRAPARIALPPQMGVGVHERRHHGLSRQVDDRRGNRHLDVTGTAHIENQVVAYDERGILDDVTIADDDPASGKRPHRLGAR